MRDTGNPLQWGDVHPPKDLIESDIEKGLSYVCVHDGRTVAVFYYNMEVETTYGKIDGKWLSGDEYGIVHRIASNRSVKGAGAYCLDWCFEQCGNIRIDTHEDNIPMRKLLEKLGYTYCGIIWLDNGDERMAFQKTDILVKKRG
jgi:hypothetical protein